MRIKPIIIGSDDGLDQWWNIVNTNFRESLFEIFTFPNMITYNPSVDT